MRRPFYYCLRQQQSDTLAHDFAGLVILYPLCVSFEDNKLAQHICKVGVQQSFRHDPDEIKTISLMFPAAG